MKTLICTKPVRVLVPADRCKLRREIIMIHGATVEEREHKRGREGGWGGGGPCGTGIGMGLVEN